MRNIIINSQLITKDIIKYIKPSFKILLSNNRSYKEYDKLQQLIRPCQIISKYNILSHFLQTNQSRPTLLIHSKQSDNLFRNCVFFEEYVKLFPYLVPIAKKQISELERNKIKKDVQERMNFEFDFQLDEPFGVNGIFVMEPIERWEEQVQIMCDLITTDQGSIGKILKPSQNPIPINWFFNEGNTLDIEDLFHSYKVCFNLLYPDNQLRNNTVYKSLIPENSTYLTNKRGELKKESIEQKIVQNSEQLQKQLNLLI